MKCLCLITCVIGALTFQSKRLDAQTYEPPRLSDGKPDLNGIWEVRGNVDANLEAKVGGKNIIVDPPDGRIPHKPEALARKKENERNRATAAPVNKCQMPGVPRLEFRGR
jgi:hypothetical protein